MSIILLFVLYMPYNFFGFHFLYYCLLLCLVDFFFVVRCLNYFLIILCVYPLAIFFVDTQGSTFNILYL